MSKTATATRTRVKDLPLETRAGAISFARFTSAEAEKDQYRILAYYPLTGDVALQNPEGDPPYNVNLILRTCDCPDFYYTIQPLNRELSAADFCPSVECKHVTLAESLLAPEGSLYGWVMTTGTQAEPIRSLVLSHFLPAGDDCDDWVLFSDKDELAAFLTDRPIDSVISPEGEVLL